MADCSNLVANMCGNRGLDFPSDSCSTVRIEGTSDTTINQGLGIDLTDGVHAYDGDGNEIPFEVEPETIPKCDVGEHLVKYTAIGKGDSMRPSLCGSNALAVSDACSDFTTVEKDRIVTITQADPPTINGIDEVQIATSAMFDPTDGVSAVDDNGNIIPFEYSGEYDLMANGDIASFETEYAQNAKSVLVELEPIQSLNGYDKPWAGGAGKNKFDASATTNLRDFSRSDETFTNTQTDTRLSVKLSVVYYSNGSQISVSNDTTITATGRYSLTLNIPTGTDTLRIRDSGSNRDLYFEYPFSGNGSYVLSADFTAVDPTTVGGLVIKNIQIEEGTSATSYEPYSNICPISGRTEVVTQRTGKNLFPNELPSDAISATLGSTITTATNARVFALPCKPNTDYTFSHPTMGTYSISIGFGTEPPTIGASVEGRRVLTNITNYTANSGNNTYLYINPSRVSEYESAVADGFQIEVGSTKTDYEAYNGHTYTTPLGRTVYGGDVEVVGGELTDKMGFITFDGTENWYNVDTSGADRNRALITNIDTATGSYNWNLIGNYITSTGDADSYPPVWKANINSAGNLLIGIPKDITTIAEWEAYLAQNPLQLCYELATPQTYSLTGQEVELLTGQNNVWSDGDVEVIYEANIPQSGSYQYPLAGNYEITYTAEDECGNKTEVARTIEVA